MGYGKVGLSLLGLGCKTLPKYWNLGQLIGYKNGIKVFQKQVNGELITTSFKNGKRLKQITQLPKGPTKVNDYQRNTSTIIERFNLINHDPYMNRSTPYTCWMNRSGVSRRTSDLKTGDPLKSKDCFVDENQVSGLRDLYNVKTSKLGTEIKHASNDGSSYSAFLGGEKNILRGVHTAPNGQHTEFTPKNYFGLTRRPEVTTPLYNLLNGKKSYYLA